MKFSQKIFIGTFVLFFFAFDAGAYILVDQSYNFSLHRENESAAREQAVILSSVQSRIADIETVIKNASQDTIQLSTIISPLSDYYQKQGVTLALYNNNTLIHSNTPDIPEDIISVKDGYKNISNKKVGDTRYLFVSSKIPDFTNLTIVYVRDISKLDVFRSDIIRVFILVSSSMCVLLGAALYILLKYFTRPIKQLKNMTDKIATGAYDERVQINRNDELGELGKTFNLMAESVESNIHRLKESTEDKQNFIDNLAHEMKTPLTAILGYSEYLQNANSSEEERILSAQHLKKTAERIQNLSVRLLDIAYMQDKEIELKPVNVSSLFATFESLINPSLSNKEVVLEIKSEISEIIGDETLLLSLLLNLVENAARASSKGAVIKVLAYKETYPIIEVVDEGFGIPADEIDRITEPFYCVDKSRSRECGGVGLGLSLCKQIALLHGAKLEIDSEINIGTSIKISFTTL